MLVLDSVSHVEDFETTVRTLQGVTNVRMMFPRNYRAHTRWIEERIQTLAAAPG